MQNLVGVSFRKDIKENAHVKNVCYHFYCLPYVYILQISFMLHTLIVLEDQ